MENLRHIIKYGKWQGQPGIIFTDTIANCKMVGNYLIVSESVESDSLRYYYGELSLADRKAILNDFLNGKCLVIVATSSFGMGIDKPNVRFVVHIHPPYSITDYMQQCGRAGRDGQAADCLAFFKGSKSFQMQRRQHKASRKLIKVTDLKTQDDKAIQIEELENYMNLETCRRWLVEHCGSNEDIPTRLDDPEAMKRCCDICRSSVGKLFFQILFSFSNFSFFLLLFFSFPYFGFMCE